MAERGLGDRLPDCASCAGIGVVVVAYYPDLPSLHRLLCECLDDDRVRHFVIVNNSPDCGLEIPPGLARSRLTVITLQTNMGIAAAQNKALTLLGEQQVQWALMLDQDSAIAGGYLDRLISRCAQVLQITDRLGVLATQPETRDGARYNTGKILTQFMSGVYEVTHCINSGSLVNVDAILSLGGFREEFFIDAVDTEICWRLRRHGYQVLLDRDNCFEHSIGTQETFCGIRYTTSPPSRIYFRVRNNLRLMFFEPAPPGISRIGYLLAMYRMLAIKLVLFRNKRDLVVMIYRAHMDAISNRMGALNSLDTALGT